MFHFVLLLAGIPFLGLAYLSSFMQVGNAGVSKKLRLDKTKQGSGLHPRAGFKDTENNMAYFNTPLPRHRAQSVTFYEAEQMENKNEIQSQILEARKSGDSVKQIETLARFHRSKDNALKNLAVDYNHQNTLVQIRRNPGITSSKRVMETIADHPKLTAISGWVPHLKSVPLPHSMGRSYWRPRQHMVHGVTTI